MFKIIQKKRKNIKNIIILSILIPYYSFAISGEESWNQLKVKNPSPITGSLSEAFGKILKDITTLFIPLLVLAYVYVGFLFVKAVGNDTKLKEAKQALLYTIIGTFIVLGAGLIKKIIEGTAKDFTTGF